MKTPTSIGPYDSSTLGGAGNVAEGEGGDVDVAEADNTELILTLAKRLPKNPKPSEGGTGGNERITKKEGPIEVSLRTGASLLMSGPEGKSLK